MKRPHIVLLTTGGTIGGAADASSGPDGYTAGVVAGDALIAALPGIRERAELRVEPCLALDSKDMQPDDWLTVARRALDLLAQDAVDGLVITHGTDTLEETALFLDLVLPDAKPVVITGAMRPSDAISADGPANLLDAIRVAIDPASAGRGVLVAFSERILPACGVVKSHPTRLDAFDATDGAIGATRPDVRFRSPPAGREAALSLPDGELPTVHIVHLAAGTPPALMQAAVELGARGLVLAMTGNGSVPAAWEAPIRALVREGVSIVRASRCGTGFVGARKRDVELGTWAAGRLSPAGARVALMLALASGGDAATTFRRIAGTTLS